jgi:hypothetical protein
MVLLSSNSLSAEVISFMEGLGVQKERLVKTAANDEWRPIKSVFMISSYRSQNRLIFSVSHNLVSLQAWKWSGHNISSCVSESIHAPVYIEII